MSPARIAACVLAVALAIVACVGCEQSTEVLDQSGWGYQRVVRQTASGPDTAYVVMPMRRDTSEMRWQRVTTAQYWEFRGAVDSLHALADTVKWVGAEPETLR